MYQVSCRGMQPTSYGNYVDAMRNYLYLYRYFGHCSIKRVSRKRYLKMLAKVR